MGPIETRRQLRTTILGLVGIGAFGMILYTMVVAHTGLPFETATTVRAGFTDTGALKPGDTCRQNAITSGKVDKIEFADGMSVVTCRMDGEHDYHANARAELRDFSALGAKYVDLDAGTPDAGPLGDRIIGTDRTKSSADLYQLYNVFDAPTRAAGASAEREFGGGLAGHGQELRAFTSTMPETLSNLGTVSDSLASRDADLPALLRADRDLSARFIGREHQITDAITQTDSTFNAITVDDSKPLAATLQKLPVTLARIHRAFDSLDSPLAHIASGFAGFEGGAKGLGDSEPTLRGFLRDAVSPFDRTPKVADEAVPAVDDLAETFHDARPLAPRLNTFFDDFAQFANDFAPYAEDAGNQFTRARSWSSENIDGIQYARITVDSGLRSVAGAVAPNTVAQNHYPTPGQADFDRVGAPIGAHK